MWWMDKEACVIRWATVFCGFSAVTYCLQARARTHIHTEHMRKIHHSIIFTWGERCWSEGTLHVSLNYQKGFSHLGCMEAWLFKKKWFKGECYYIIYSDLYSRMWEWCTKLVIFSIFATVWQVSFMIYWPWNTMRQSNVINSWLPQGCLPAWMLSLVWHHYRECNQASLSNINKQMSIWSS